MRPGQLALALLIAGASVGVVNAQRGRFGDTPAAFQPTPNAHYDGRFTFARLTYTTGRGGFYYHGLPAWAHGYPNAEGNLMKIMNEVSLLGAHADGFEYVALDDPDLHKYPVCYMTEAGYWTMTDAEASMFRSYLTKGGFVIFDDFRGDFRGGGGWDNFEANMTRVIPGARFLEMDASHPIFHAFFEIDSFDIIPQDYDRGRPVLRGLFEGNDPQRRLMAMVNFNTDVSNFWEFSGQGLRPIDESNEAYKLGVNYLIYGMTH